MSVPESEMLDELARRVAEEGAAPLEGEHIPASEVPPDMGFDFDPKELTADTLELLLGMAAPNWIAESTPEQLRITREKIDKLAQPYFALLVKYLPGLFERFPLEMAALVQTVVVVMPLVKAGVPPRLPKAKPQDEKKPATDAAPPA